MSKFVYLQQELRGLNKPFLVTGVFRNGLLQAGQQALCPKSPAQNFDKKHICRYTAMVSQSTFIEKVCWHRVFK